MRRFVGSIALLIVCWVAVDASANNTFTIASAGGMVVGPDHQTLIVSVPTEGKLVYFDTLAEAQLKEIEVDFQPTLMAIQGKHLLVGSRGSSNVFVLDWDTAKMVRQISVGGEPLLNLSCNVLKGPLYAVNLQDELFSIDIETGKVTKTAGKGQLLAVDPSDTKYLYTGIQKPINEILVIRDVGPNEVQVSLAQAGVRALMLKYQVNGTDLKLLAANDNAAQNGKALAVSNDGKTVAMAGGGGWASKTDPHYNYAVAVFETEKMEGLQGLVDTEAYPVNIAFHPVLKMGAAVRAGKYDQVIVFNAKSLVRKGIFDTKTETVNATGLLCFGGMGTKVIFCSSLRNKAKQYAVQMYSLPITEGDRDILVQAYGSKVPPAVK